ncbi:MAG: polysaccharide deacetylase family protein [Mycobacteriaceae bacterium]|nr:polysaccharide deacetylase family protein [Mycobacteriaceae bacterium]
MGISWRGAGSPKAMSASNGAPGAAPNPTGPTMPGLLPPPGPQSRVELPGDGVLSKLPGEGDLLAWTVDDGVDTDVVRLYTQFAKDTGIRLTYFVNGIYRSWTDNAALLRPLVESGQIQLANHTWSHPDLTKVSKSRIADELSRNDRFLRDTYGVDATPYFRPPYGNHNAEVDEVAADLGYRMATLWCGTLGDSSVLSEDDVVKMADQFFTAQNIVIGHLNHQPVTHVYGQLVDIIRARALRTVTLNDVFLRPEIPHLT